MSERIIMVLFNGFTLLVLLILQTLTPRITRKNILLGVKIPEEEMKSKEVKNIIQGFIKENLIVGIPVLFLISLLIYFVENVYLYVMSTFLYIGVLFVVYIKWNKEAKKLKNEKGWDKLGEGVVFVDTKFSRDKGKISTLSKKWFLIPVVIIIISTILSFIKYPSLPDKVPTHWDLKGNIDGYMHKSMFVALMMPLTQIFMAIVLYIVYYFSITSKQQINPKNPDISLKKNIIFRKAWSIFFIVSLTLIELLFTFLNMLVLGIIKYSPIINIFMIITFGFSIVGSLVLSLMLGQGGDRLRLKGDNDSIKGYDINDDHLWKLGNTIYYNPDDSSIFVEKRVGVGWTVNAGRPLGIIIMLLPFVITIINLVLIR